MSVPLLQQLEALPVHERDAWVDRMLGFGELPDDGPDLPPGGVPYFPASVEEILGMVREAPLRPGDELVDLGSGAGRVVILAHLLSGVRARGIEIQQHLVALARDRAAALGMAGVTFVHGDAREVELDGSVFFLYAPFNGSMLARVLERLAAVARRRPIVICAVGVQLYEVPWLRARPTSCVSLTIYDSVT